MDLGSDDAAPAALEIEIDRGQEATLVRLEGELDIATTAELEQHLSDAEASGTKLLVVDMRELKFIDSSGLRLLLEAGQRASEGQWRLLLVRGPIEVDRIFRMTGADRQLELVDEPPPAH